MFFFLPIATTRPCWRAPWVTYLLILLNATVFGMQHDPAAVSGGPWTCSS